MSESTPGVTEKGSRSHGSSDSRALVLQNPLDWFRIFGPGAVIASLTIGAGELIFSSRGGALFGYRLLWFFALVLLFKWALVFASTRHIVLTGAHPFQRWMDLPGPRGWLPLTFFILALPCFPIWVCFHAGTVGTLVSWLAGTEEALHGAAYLLWGMLLLSIVLFLIFNGGYARLERMQIGITTLLVFAVVLSLFWLKPDWVELVKGLLLPQSLQYPAWVSSYPDIAARPVWVETVTYVGIIGGSGYDYLAYASYIRDKGWGQAGKAVADARLLKTMAENPAHANRSWVRACVIDSTLSFLAVLIFTAVFVACGTVVLGPQHKVPTGMNLLPLQAEFVTPIYAWLKWVYFGGAFLAMFGTLYGTIEVAPTVLRELLAAARPSLQGADLAKSRTWSVLWVGLGGMVLLVGNFTYALMTEVKTPSGLIALLTPANLFTGVLACGIICLLNCWMDRRFLPPALRMNWLLGSLNLAAGISFLLLGLKGYWDHSGWKSWVMLAGTLAVGWMGAYWWNRVVGRDDRRN